jgi:hypothetical protein
MNTPIFGAPGAWTELDAPGALEVATRALQFGVPVMTIELARTLARRFVASFEDGAIFLTNGLLALEGRGARYSNKRRLRFAVA